MDNAEKLSTQPTTKKKKTKANVQDAAARKHTQTRHEPSLKQLESKKNRTSFLWGNSNLVS